MLLYDSRTKAPLENLVLIELTTTKLYQVYMLFFASDNLHDRFASFLGRACRAASTNQSIYMTKLKSLYFLTVKCEK